MATNTQLNLVISAQDNASKTIKNVSNGVNTLGSKSMNVLKTGAKAAALAVGTLAGVSVAFGVSSLKAFANAEASQKRFETGLKNIAKASDEEIASLRKQQLALQGVTRYEDDAIASAQGFLATFQLNAKQIEKITPDLLDMAEGLRTAEGGTIGLEQASNMLGKAMQMGTLTMLRRVGVTVPGTTKAMQDLYEEKFQNAKMDERLAMLGTMLQGNFKGQAQAAGETLAGKIDILNNTWGNFKENLGGFLYNILNPIIPKLQEFSNKLQNLNIPATVLAGWDDIKNKVNAFFNETNYVWVFIRDFFKPIIDSLAKTFKESWDKIVKAIQPIKPELEYLAKFFGVVLLGVLMVAAKSLQNLVETFVKGATGIIQAFSLVVQGLKKYFEIIFNNFFNTVQSIKNAWQEVVNFLSKPLNAVVNITESVKKKLRGKAFGGSVSSGTPYIVGEHRPEVFVPSQSGNIRQENQIGGREITVNFNNVNVRSDYDLDTIIKEVKKTLNRDSLMASYGIKTV